jgi:uncharacterized membrane protein
MDNDSHIKRYSERVEQVVNEYEKSISQQLNEQYFKKTKWSDRLADRIADFGGSWNFIILFAIFLFIWIIVNSTNVVEHFDPSPFILLNLVLSFLSAFQAPVIMMSQNRQAARDRDESVISFAINFRAEKEIDDMQNHLHKIEEEIGLIKELLIKNDEN